MNIGFIKFKNYKVPSIYKDQEGLSQHCAHALSSLDNLVKNSCYKFVELFDGTVSFVDLDRELPLPEGLNHTCLRDHAQALIKENPRLGSLVESRLQDCKEKREEPSHYYELLGYSQMLSEIRHENEEAFNFNIKASQFNFILHTDNKKFNTLYLLSLAAHTPEDVCQDLIDHNADTADQFIKCLSKTAKENITKYGFEKALARGSERAELYTNGFEYDPDMLLRANKMKFKDCENSTLAESCLKLETARINKALIDARILYPQDLMLKFASIFHSSLSCAFLMDQDLHNKMLIFAQEGMTFIKSDHTGFLNHLIWTGFYNRLKKTMAVNAPEIVKENFIFSLNKYGFAGPEIEKKAETIIKDLKKDDFIRFSLSGKVRECKEGELPNEQNSKLVEDPFMKAFKTSQNVQECILTA